MSDNKNIRLDNPVAITMALRNPNSDLFKLMNEAIAKRQEYIWIHELYAQLQQADLLQVSQEREAENLKDEIRAEQQQARTMEYNAQQLASKHSENHPEFMSETDIKLSIQDIQKQIDLLHEQVRGWQSQQDEFAEVIVDLQKGINQAGQKILDDSVALQREQEAHAQERLKEFMNDPLVDAQGVAVPVTTENEEQFMRALTPVPMHQILKFNPALREHLHQGLENGVAGMQKAVMDGAAAQIKLIACLAKSPADALTCINKNNLRLRPFAKLRKTVVDQNNHIIHDDKQKKSLEDELNNVKNNIVNLGAKIEGALDQITELEMQKRMLNGVGVLPRLKRDG